MQENQSGSDAVRWTGRNSPIGEAPRWCCAVPWADQRHQERFHRFYLADHYAVAVDVAAESPFLAGGLGYPALAGGLPEAAACTQLRETMTLLR